MANLDRRRAARLMSEKDVAGLILLSPESFTYATGAVSGVATMWRKAGAVAVFVPADAEMPETAVVSDLFAPSFRRSSHITDIRESPIWVETANIEGIPSYGGPEQQIHASWQATGRTPDFERPETFDAGLCYRTLADILNERGLSGARIGFEASAISAHDFDALRSALGLVELVDATELIARLKMVKSEDEISALRLAAEIAETGIVALRNSIAVGVTRDELAATWRRAVQAHPRGASLTGTWEYVSVGANPWGGNAAVKTGDLIKVDVGCLVQGYTSDTGRTFVCGPPNETQTRIFDALMRGFMAGSKLLRPGMILSDIHRTTLAAIRAAGFPGYTRGHFGHGLGAGLGSEEWPFISASSGVVLEPGMVMAFECPWYIDGLGGMIIENQVLITESGHEMMNTLPIDLVQVMD